MSKITLDSVASGYDLSKINANFVAIAAELNDKVLYRDNPVGETNTLITPIDANSQQIYNLPEPLLSHQAARLQDVQNGVAGATANLIAFTPSGNIVADTVQGAIQELDTEKVSTTYTNSATGGVDITVQDKFEQYVSSTEFDAVGDGVANDTIPLTNFFNSAIANPGVPHRLEVGEYLVNAQLPTINVSNVIIIGAGAAKHDVNNVLTGSVITWNGTAGATMQVVSSVSGASNSRVSNVVLKGIAYNCSGTAAYGIVCKSIFECDIDIAVANSTSFGLYFDVVAALGEARDCQRNKIKFIGRQVEADGVGIGATGDTVANFSMNEIWADIQHYNAPGIYLINSDNNDWWFVRIYKSGGGTATDSISLLGGATANNARSERFHFVSSTVTVHAYGTEAFTYPSTDNRIFCLDASNGTPDPVVGTSATLNWAKDTSELPDNPWISYTPTITALSGTITTKSATGRYARRGKLVYVRAEISITTNGTGAGQLLMTLPLTTAGTIGGIFSGMERSLSPNAIIGFVDGASSSLAIINYDGTYPGADGTVFILTGFYEVA